ncbi:hypothetical protein FQR65_LT11561 [Abscondita terminalis]|nr:hypothetical protein FQR65_LT11561 [Abscondita terminalis]
MVRVFKTFLYVIIIPVVNCAINIEENANSELCNCIKRVVMHVYTEEETLLVVTSSVTSGYVFPNTIPNPRLLFDELESVDSSINFKMGIIFYTDATKSVKENIYLVYTSELVSNNYNANVKWVIITSRLNITDYFLELWKLGVTNFILLVNRSSTNTTYHQLYTSDVQAIPNNCGQTLGLVNEQECNLEITIEIPEVIRKYLNCPFVFVNSSKMEKSTDLSYLVPQFLMTLLAKHLYANSTHRNVNKENKVYVIPTYLRFKGDRQVSAIFFSPKVIWAVPKPKQIPLTEVIKIIFKKTVWALIATSLLIIAIFWWLIAKYKNKCTNDHYDFTMILLDIWQSTILGSVNKVPVFWVLRFICISYIVYSIHIQAIINSKIVEILTIPQFERGIQNLEDLSQSNLQIIVEESLNFTIFEYRDLIVEDRYSKIYQLLCFVPGDDFVEEFFDCIRKDLCAAMFLGIEDFLNNTFFEEAHTFHDNSLTGNLEYVLQVFYYNDLYLTLNKFVNVFVESGIVDQYVKNVTNKSSLVLYETKEPVPLTVDHIFIIIIFWGAETMKMARIFTTFLLYVIINPRVNCAINIGDVNRELCSCVKRVITHLYMEEETLLVVLSSATGGYVFPNTVANPRLVLFSDQLASVDSSMNFKMGIIFYTDATKSVKENIYPVLFSELVYNNYNANVKWVIITSRLNITDYFLELWKVGVTNFILLVNRYSRNNTYHQLYTSDVQAIPNNCGQALGLVNEQECNLEITIQIPEVIRKHINCPFEYKHNFQKEKHTDLSYLVPQFLMSLIAKHLNANYTNTNNISQENKVYVFANYLRFKGNRPVSAIFYSPKVRWVVPKPKRIPMTEAIKIIFKKTVWALIATSFLIIAVVWWLIAKYKNKCTDDHYDFKLILLNIWQSTILGYVNRVPVFWVLRFIFICYIVYSIHIQAIINSKIVEILTIPQFEKGIQNLEELSQSNLQIIAEQNLNFTLFEYRNLIVEHRYSRIYPLLRFISQHHFAKVFFDCIRKDLCAAMILGYEIFLNNTFFDEAHTFYDNSLTVNRAIIIEEDFNTELCNCIKRVIMHVYMEEETLLVVPSSATAGYVFPNTVANPRLVLFSDQLASIDFSMKFKVGIIFYTDATKNVKENIYLVLFSGIVSNNYNANVKWVIITSRLNITDYFLELWKLGVTNFILLVNKSSRNNAYQKLYTSDVQAIPNNCGQALGLVNEQECNLEITIQIPEVIRKHINCPFEYIHNFQKEKYTDLSYLVPQFLMSLIAKHLNANYTYNNIRKENKVYVFANYLRFKGDRPVSAIFYSPKVTWVVPKPKRIPMTEAIKIIFKKTVWALIATSFLIIAVVWWLIAKYKNKCTDDHYDFKLILLNIWQSTILGYVNRVPVFWVLRFIFICYIVYSIHIQAIINSKIVEILTIPQFERGIQNLEELSQSNLQIIAEQNLNFTLFEYRNLIVEHRYSKIYPLLRFIPQHHLAKVFFDCIRKDLCAAMFLGYEIFLNNTFFDEAHTFYDNSLTDVFVESGIINQYVKNATKKSSPISYDTKEPVPLAVNHLFIIIIFWGAEDVNSELRSCIKRVIMHVYMEEETLLVVPSLVTGGYVFPNTVANPRLVLFSDQLVSVDSSINFKMGIIFYTDATKSVKENIYPVLFSELVSNNYNANVKWVIITSRLNITDYFLELWKVGVTNFILLVNRYSRNNTYHQLYTSDVQAIPNNCGQALGLVNEQECKLEITIQIPEVIRKYINCPFEYIHNFQKEKHTDLSYLVPQFLMSLIAKHLNANYTHNNIRKENKVYVFANYLRFKGDRPVSAIFYSPKVMWAVPKPKRIPMTEVIKIIFKKTVWALIATFFLIIAIVWWLIAKYKNKCTDDHYDFKLILLNIWQSTILGYVNRVPVFWVLRFIFISYIVYSIHIQAIINSKIVEILTIPQFEKGIQNLEELSQSNLQIIAEQNLNFTLFEYRDLIVEHRYSRIYSLLHFVTDYDFVRAFFDCIRKDLCAAMFLGIETFLNNTFFEESHTFYDNSLTGNLEYVLQVFYYNDLYLTINKFVDVFVESGIVNQYMIMRLLPALQIIIILCAPTLSYPVFGTKRYNGRSPVIRKSNSNYNYSWGSALQPYQQFLRSQRFPVNYYEMYPYGRDYQDEYYYPQEAVSYPLYIPPPRTSKYEVYQAVLPYYYGSRPDYGYYGYEKDTEPAEAYEEDLIQDAQREEREDAQPIGQEVLYENEGAEDNLDDVNAAFLQNLIMSQMYKDATNKQKDYYDPYPNTDYYYDEDNYGKWDDSPISSNPGYQEDEDVRELKQLVKTQKQNVYKADRGPTPEERLHSFRKENKNKNLKYNKEIKYNWDNKRSGEFKNKIIDHVHSENKDGLKTTSAPVVSTTIIPRVTSNSPKRELRRGQKEEVLMRPATPIKNPFSSKVLEMMKEPERKREPSVYDTIKHMLDVEKSLENDTISSSLNESIQQEKSHDSNNHGSEYEKSQKDSEAIGKYLTNDDDELLIPLVSP